MKSRLFVLFVLLCLFFYAGSNYLYITKEILIDYMFPECKSLNELNVSNFNIKNEDDISDIFDECSDEIIAKIKSLNKKNHGKLKSEKKNCIII